MWAKRSNTPIKTDYQTPQKPITSWVIRTYNEEKWIGTVLNALLLQSRQDFEIIVIDSHSTDKTIEIVKKYPIKLIQIEKRDFGFSSTLNSAIRKTKGKYIGILSGHSVPASKTFYEDGVKNFKQQKVAAVTGYYIALPDGNAEEKAGTLVTLASMKIKHFDPWMTNTNAIIRKGLWKIYPFDEDLDKDGCEDYDWANEMLTRGYDVIKDPKFLVHHSHGGLGRPTYKQRLAHWKRVCTRIDKKKRNQSPQAN